MTPPPAPRAVRRIHALPLAWFVIVFLSAHTILAATVTGIVTDGAGKPLKGMTVAAYNASGSAVAVVTDSKGKYSVSFSGEARLIAYENSASSVYATTFAGNAESFETTPTISSDQTNYNFVMNLGGVVQGSVTSSENIIGSDITVAAYNPSGTRRGFTKLINGQYRLLLPSGSYKLVAYDESPNRTFLPVFYRGKSSFELADFVSVNAPSSLTADFSVRGAAHILGVVSDAQAHTSLSGLLVNAYTIDGALVATTTTDAFGGYNLVLPDGAYRLLVVDPRGVYATSYFSGAASFSQTSVLTLKAGQTLQNVPLEAERGGFVTGRVTASGTVVCCVVVVAYNPDGSPRASSRTDGLGGYQLVLPPGVFIIGAYDESSVYSAKFYADSNTFRGSTPVSVVRSQNRAAVDVSLDRAARVIGSVSDATTKLALGGVAVSAYDSDGYLAKTVTVSAGSYVLALPAGSYRLLAFDSALRYVTTYPESATTFEESPVYSLASGTTRNVDFQLNAGTRVSGTVSTLSRIPLSGIDIAAFSLSGYRVASTTTHEGTFDLVLPPGSYKLAASDAQHRYSTSFFNSAGGFPDATAIQVTATGSTPGGLDFILLPQLRHRSVGH